MTAPKVQGIVLFEQYEANGSLLFVTSDASLIERVDGDQLYKRPWATGAPAEPWGPNHRPTAANCLAGGPGAPISSGLVCQVCPPLRPGTQCAECGTVTQRADLKCPKCGVA